MQEGDVEGQDNLHEVDEVEVYGEAEDKLDEEGKDKENGVVVEEFFDEGLVDVSLEGDTANESRDGYVECEVEGIQKIMQKKLVLVNNSVLIHMRIRLKE